MSCIDPRPMTYHSKLVRDKFYEKYPLAETGLIWILQEKKNNNIFVTENYTSSKYGYWQLTESLSYMDQFSSLNNIPSICLDWMYLYNKNLCHIFEDNQLQNIVF